MGSYLLIDNYIRRITHNEIHAFLKPYDIRRITHQALHMSLQDYNPLL